MFLGFSLVRKRMYVEDYSTPIYNIVIWFARFFGGVRDVVRVDRVKLRAENRAAPA